MNLAAPLSVHGTAQRHERPGLAIAGNAEVHYVFPGTEYTVGDTIDSHLV